MNNETVYPLYMHYYVLALVAFLYIDIVHDAIGTWSNLNGYVFPFPFLLTPIRPFLYTAGPLFLLLCHRHFKRPVVAHKLQH